MWHAACRDAASTRHQAHFHCRRFKRPQVAIAKSKTLLPAVYYWWCHMYRHPHLSGHVKYLLLLNINVSLYVCTIYCKYELSAFRRLIFWLRVVVAFVTVAFVVVVVVNALLFLTFLPPIHFAGMRNEHRLLYFATFDFDSRAAKRWESNICDYRPASLAAQIHFLYFFVFFFLCFSAY